jgi:hypothetical protein
MYPLFNSNYGYITHYYHFFYGVLVPIILEVLKDRNKCFYTIQNFGPMTRILYEIPTLNIVQKCINDITDNNWFFNVKAYDTFKSAFLHDKSRPHLTVKDKNNICKFFDETMPEYLKQLPTYDVILIERNYEDTYSCQIENKIKINKFTSKKLVSGKKRRYIENHSDIEKFLKKKYSDKFKNFILERVNIYYQYLLFSKAKIIIAQHGAVLANILFMKPKKSTVIEIQDLNYLEKEGEDTFQNICKVFNINYKVYMTETQSPTLSLTKLNELLN